MLIGLSRETKGSQLEQHKDFKEIQILLVVVAVIEASEFVDCLSVPTVGQV